MKKKTWKILGIVSAIIILALTVLGLGVRIYQDSLERNPDNLLTVDESYIDDKKTDYGLEVKVDDDGVIKFSGQTSRNEELLVQKLTLEPGTYTISGIEELDISKMSLSAKYGSNVAYAGGSSATFVLEETTEVSVVITIMGTEDGENTISWANKTIKPVLVKGDKPGEFWL